MTEGEMIKAMKRAWVMLAKRERDEPNTEYLTRDEVRKQIKALGEPPEGSLGETKIQELRSMLEWEPSV